MANRMQNQKKDAEYLNLLRAVFALSFFLTGLFYEMESAVVSVLLGLLLLWYTHGNRCRAVWNISFIAVLLLWAGYLFSALWGVDSGIALWGAVKYLPVLLFALCLMQTDAAGRWKIAGDLPWIGALMTVLTFILQLIPATASLFTVSGRMAGFFQYPNTFACFLLLGIVVLLTQKAYDQWSLVALAILVFGLLQAGSRSIYVIAVPVIIASLMVRLHEERRIQKQAHPAVRTEDPHGKTGRIRGFALLAASFAAGIALSAAAGLAGYAVVTDRVTAISANESTFLGRLLYWKDAIGVIADHPFGLGYLGYYMTQGSFQTGVYSVRYVHNDFLQILLDVGWIPAAFALAAVIFSLVSKRMNAKTRLLLLTLAAHCFVDFDLEFVSMYFILLLCLDWEAGVRYAAKIPAVAGAAACLVLGFFSIYIGLDSSLTYAGLCEAASDLYPYNTLANVELLSLQEDEEALEALADRILAQNDEVAAAWDAKALAAYSDGDFENYITYKRTAISLNRYDLTEYEDYFVCLKTGVELYLEADDTDSALACMIEIVEIQNLLDELEAQTDPLAFRLADVPDFTMSEEYQEYIAQAAE